jgi:hypothetical protein
MRPSDALCMGRKPNPRAPLKRQDLRVHEERLASVRRRLASPERFPRSVLCLFVHCIVTIHRTWHSVCGEAA